MRFCGACGSPLEQPEAAPGAGDAAGDAQRRHMTVMFCDLVSSTPLSELLDPEDFREVLRGYQHACARAIERFQGHTAKYIGDGVVAFFGYPHAHEDDAQRAVHAGLRIVEEIVALNERLREQLDISLQVRIGLHTGLVVAGEMGAGQAREQLAIVGETPHIAARLQSIAQPGSVVMTGATHELVADDFELEPLGPTTLKGISRLIEAHRVVRPIGDGDRLKRSVGRARKPIVGREREQAQLAQAWERARAGEGVVVHISGDAGIGKSRLVQAARETSTQVAAERLLRCSPHHSRTALFPVVRFLEQNAGLEPTQDPEQQLRALARFAADAGVDAEHCVPLLAELLSIPAGNETARKLTPRDTRSATLRVLEDLLVGDGAGHPLLVIIEDLHWADPTTIELLGRIVRRVRRVPVACLLTFRSGFVPPWSRRAAVEIALGPLGDEDVRAMASAVSAQTLDAATLERVESTCDGVPLFVEEMVKLLTAGGPETRRRQEQGVIPPTLEGLLTERLDRLASVGEVIDIAAVLGREFERSLLDGLSPITGLDLEAMLAQLAAEDVLHPVEGAPSRLEFTQALLQEAAYERLLRRRRQALHGRVAALLARRSPADGQPEPDLIAHHWSCAGQPAKAVAYWHQAGTGALHRAAFLEAAELFRRGFEDLEAAGEGGGDESRRADFLTHLGAALAAGRGYAAAGVDEAYARAKLACERASDDGRLVRVIRGQWMLHLLRAEYQTAQELADEMIALGERTQRPACLAEGHLFLGLGHMYLASFDAALEQLREAFRRHHRPDEDDEVYEAQGDTGVGALAYLALVLWNQGHVEESRKSSDRSLQLVEHVGSPMTRAQAWGMRSLFHFTRAEVAELSHWLQKARGYSAERNIDYWRTVCSLFLGWLQGRAGELALGTARLEENLNAYLDSGSRLGLTHFYILLADLRLQADDRSGALAALYAGEAHIEATGERFSESELFCALGKTLMAGDSPDADAATTAYEDAVGAAHQQNAKLLELRAATRFAMHQQAIGDDCTALPRVSTLCEWFPPATQAPDVMRARMLVAGQEVLAD
jgi:class 3 adenylate cyclase